MPNPNPNTAGLKPNKSNDVQGPTECRTIRFEVGMLQWLNSQPGGINYHVREAVREYRKQLSEGNRNDFL